MQFTHAPAKGNNKGLENEPAVSVIIMESNPVT